MTGNIALKKLTSAVSGSATRVKEIWLPFWRILTFSLADDAILPQKSLCVSVESGHLTIVYGIRFLSRIKIKDIRNYSIEGDRYPQPENLVSSVALAVNQMNISKADITLSIPKSWTIIKVAEFPSTARENIQNVISYEMDRLTPLSYEEAFYDFKVLKEVDGKLTVVVYAVKADLIRSYLEALKEKGLNVTRVTTSLSGIGALCSHINKGADTIFLEINKDEYKSALFIGGSMKGAITDSIETEDAKLKLDDIMAGIEPLVQDTKKEGRSPQLAVLLRDRDPVLKEMLKVRTNMVVEMLDEIDIKLSLPPVKEIPYEAIGVALESLQSKANGLNLLKKGITYGLSTPMHLTAVLTLALLAMIGLYMFAPLRIERAILREIDTQIALRKDDIKKVEALKKEIEGFNSEVSKINSFKENRTMSMDILGELTAILPKTSWVTRVKVTETTIDMEGYAGTATELLQRLEASKYFKKAEFASPTFRDTRLNMDRFIIKMEIEGKGKDEVKGFKNEKK